MFGKYPQYPQPELFYTNYFHTVYLVPISLGPNYMEQCCLHVLMFQRSCSSSKEMAFDPYKYEMPGESLYEGILYPTTHFEPEVRAKVLDWQGHPKDIVVASYPKTGK